MHINSSFYFQWRTLICTLMFGACHASSLETDIIWDPTSKKGSSLIAVIINGLAHHTIGSNWRTAGISGSTCCTSCIQYNSVIASFRSKIYWTLYMHVCICTCIYTLNILSQYTNVSWYDICGVVQWCVMPHYRIDVFLWNPWTGKHLASMSHERPGICNQPPTSCGLLAKQDHARCFLKRICSQNPTRANHRL